MRIDIAGLAFAAPALLMVVACLFSVAAGVSYERTARAVGADESDERSFAKRETRTAARMAAFFAVLAVVAYFVGPSVAESIAETLSADTP